MCRIYSHVYANNAITSPWLFLNEGQSLELAACGRVSCQAISKPAEGASSNMCCIANIFPALAIKFSSIDMHFILKAGMRPNDCARSRARYAAGAEMPRGHHPRLSNLRRECSPRLWILTRLSTSDNSTGTGS